MKHDMLEHGTVLELHVFLDRESSKLLQIALRFKENKLLR
jgi:hypothetical protein